MRRFAGKYQERRFFVEDRLLVQQYVIREVDGLRRLFDAWQSDKSVEMKVKAITGKDPLRPVPEFWGGGWRPTGVALSDADENLLQAIHFFRLHTAKVRHYSMFKLGRQDIRTRHCSFPYIFFYSLLLDLCSV